MNLPADGVSVTVNSQKFMVYRCGDVWRLLKNGDWRFVENTANHNKGYNQIGCNGKSYMRHRIIAYAYLNLDIDDTTNQIDHINGNRLCNHIDNLRIATNQENCQNRIKAKGYYWHNPNNKWKATITVNNKHIHLGYFSTEAEARQAYLSAKLIYHPSAPIPSPPLEDFLSPHICGSKEP